MVSTLPNNQQQLIPQQPLSEDHGNEGHLPPAPEYRTMNHYHSPNVQSFHPHPLHRPYEPDARGYDEECCEYPCSIARGAFLLKAL